jgi:alkanesulfonate monooxygenase SsuD/methylene tetrahydromethanopterin reductase-like flavin-dependent oxidoreductase (luciferase family)
VALVTHLAFELRTSTPDSLTAGLAERVETSGYHSLWVNHPPDEDGLGRLAQMAAATTRITLGTAVVPVSAVPPDAILRRIDETGLPPERLRLGIGSGWGAKPLERMADAVVYLRERTPAEIVVGALGPRMRALGATQADGVLLNNVTPDLARTTAGEIRAQAKAAGRPVPGVYVNVMAAVGAAQIAELEGSAASCRGCLPTPRTSAGPASGPSRPGSRPASSASCPRCSNRGGTPSTRWCSSR